MAVARFYLIARLVFDPETTSRLESRDLGVLSRRIRESFAVAASPLGPIETTGTAGIAIAALGERQDSLSALLDDIIRHCEDSGFGRVVSESSFLEPLDRDFD
jgi:hypothetical protein